jgi:hypothetical protein
MRRLLHALVPLLTVALTAACTTVVEQRPGQTAQFAPQLSVERFLQAANDRDLDTMGRIFGTANGPISNTGGTLGCAFKKIGSWFGGHSCVTQQEVQIRLDAIARLLHHEDYKITHEEQVAGRDHPSTRVFVDMTIDGQKISDVPFVVVRTPAGLWLVEQIGLEQLMAKEE